MAALQIQPVEQNHKPENIERETETENEQRIYFLQAIKSEAKHNKVHKNSNMFAYQ